jgi:hypothetical protein
MNVRLIAAAVASIFVGWAAQSLAQSNADGATGTVTQPDKRDTFTHGESKRCESMTGADKARCDEQEATKSEGDAGQASQPAATDDRRSSAGSSAAGKTFTHGESKRCEGMTGADKDQCDKEEATKTQGDAAREASK